MLPARDRLTICFAHGAYRMAERFALRDTGIAHVEVRTADELARRLPQADVLVVSMLWKNELAGSAGKLKFIQSISAGTDQYDRALLRERGIRLASAAGVNAEAVAEHAMALMLALARRLPEARDNQSARRWRGMISEIAAREDQLAGKTLLIVGLGRIGSRLARLAKAFDMRVIATRRDPSAAADGVDAVHRSDRLHELLGRADVVALTCPLTPETENLIDAPALAAMKPTAHLINVARGRVVDEPALIEALRQHRIAGAGLDVAREEPLAAASPLWAMPHVLITPHTAGETQVYEDAVIDILLENLERLWRGETALRNQVV
ncbi:MAG TPA: D-2-hydroxyacid dehydrogenase [Burkholderiaceae bacterium]|nr:D-2-hydroxyacid dehydrogenase [Burkholderiaceae bacterium]